VLSKQIDDNSNTNDAPQWKGVLPKIPAGSALLEGAVEGSSAPLEGVIDGLQEGSVLLEGELEVGSALLEGDELSAFLEGDEVDEGPALEGPIKEA
jgi:hypothetical protein